MPQKNDALKTRLTALLARIDTGYSQDACDPGQIHETDASTIAEAIPGCLGQRYTLISPKFMDLLDTMGADFDDATAHADFMQAVEDGGFQFGNVLYAAVGDPECFSPNRAHSNGGWYFCFLFLRANCVDKNLLVTFRTSDT